MTDPVLSGALLPRRVLVPVDVPAVARLPVAADAAVHSLGGETMGTTWSVKLVAPASFSLTPVRESIARALGEVVSEMSTWLGDSDISRFNRAPSDTWHELPAGFFEVLSYALTVARKTGGAFDPTVGALVDLWGFGPPGQRATPPDDDSITRASNTWSRLKLADGRRAQQPGGVQLDLSGVAKGYAVDRVAEVLARMSLVDHLVEIGGELRGNGVKPDGTPWWVALEGAPEIPEAVVALHGLAIATSGDAQRYFMSGDRRLSHTIDPRTGRPVPDRMATVTVLHRRCMCADALATALTVLGPEGGFDYAQACGIAARFILRRSKRLEERITPAFAAMLD